MGDWGRYTADPAAWSPGLVWMRGESRMGRGFKGRLAWLDLSVHEGIISESWNKKEFEYYDAFFSIGHNLIFLLTFSLWLKEGRRIIFHPPGGWKVYPILSLPTIEIRFNGLLRTDDDENIPTRMIEYHYNDLQKTLKIRSSVRLNSQISSYRKQG